MSCLGLGLELNRFVAGGAALVPASSPYLWVKADAGTPSGTDGSSVATWSDQSGNGHDFTGASNPPKLLLNQIRGLPLIRFTASTSDLLSYAVNIPQPHTVLYAARIKSAGASHRVLFGATNNYLMGWHQNYDTYYDGTISFLTGVSEPRGVMRAYSMVGLGGQVSFYNNGTALFTNQSSSFTLPGLGLGASGDGGCDCDVAELLVYNSALSDVLRQQTEAYLAQRWL